MESCFLLLPGRRMWVIIPLMILWMTGSAQNVGIGIVDTPTHKLTLQSLSDSTLLRLIGPDSQYGFGARLNFGDDNYVYIEEDADDHLTIFGAIRIAIIGGNVGIGTTTPDAKLEVAGDVKVNGKISNVTNPVAAQDAATKAYVDLLEAQVMQLQGIKDIDNNRYDIVTIGTQVWMAENLRVTRYSDGTPIALVTNPTDWSNLTTPGHTWYNNGASDYGALYNYYTVADSNSLYVCPVGWHLPTDAEWTILSDELGGLIVAGGKLKETGLEHWVSPNAEATNFSGFAGLPGGYHNEDGSFGFTGLFGDWWSSTEHSTDYAWSWALYCCLGDLMRNTSSKRLGFSVRCLRD